MQKIKIIIIEKKNILRESLVRSLENEEDIAILGNWARIEESPLFKGPCSFNIAIIDKRTFDEDVKTDNSKLKQANPKGKIILLLLSAKNEELIDTLNYGIDGIITSGTGFKEMLDTIRIVSKGETILNQDLMNCLIRYCYADETIEHPSTLTKEEIDILQFASKGLVNKDISRKTGISISMVKFKFHQIFMKLGVNDRTHAVVEAIKKGLIDL